MYYHREISRGRPPLSMNALDSTLAYLDRELNSVRDVYSEDVRSEYAIFGSTAIVLRGIVDRVPGDVDVMVSRRLWGFLLARRGWTVLTPQASHPPILVFETSPLPLHLFYEWDDAALWMNPETVIAGASEVDGFRLAAVAEVLRHKREALSFERQFPAVAKHRPDVEAIERWLAGDAYESERAALDACTERRGCPSTLHLSTCPERKS